MRATLGRAEEVGNPRLQSLCWHALGAVQYLRGEWGESRHALACAVELARSVGATLGEVLGEQRLGVLETGLGELQTAHERLERALATARASRSPMIHGHGIGRVLASLAYNRLQAGDLGGATGYLAEGFAMQQKVGDCSSCDVLLYPVAVPLYIVLGDLNQAEAACAKAEETATAFGSQAWAASARYLRGLLAAALGDRDGAAGAFEAAREIFEALGQPYDLARTLEALAEVAASCGREEEARAHRRRAADLYARLGTSRTPSGKPIRPDPPRRPGRAAHPGAPGRARVGS